MQENGQPGRIKTASVKQYKDTALQLAMFFGACIQISSAPNSAYGLLTAVMGMLNAARSAKNITSIARAERESERMRRACTCRHKGKCKYKCKCKKECKCKYWRSSLFPSYEWIRSALAGADRNAALDAFRQSVKHDMRALHRARMLRGGRILIVAFDKHAIRHHARGAGLLFGLFNKHVGWHEVYMTAHVVVAGERFTIGVVPLGRGMGNHKAVKLLMAEVKRVAPNARMILADKEFAVTQVINEVKAGGCAYAMAHPHSKKTDKLIDELEKSGNSEMVTKSTMKSKGSREAAEYYIVIRHSRNFKTGKWKAKDGLRAKYVIYAVSDPDIDADLYATRWGIETSYRMDEAARARTASRSHDVRIFFFAFTLALYNIWVVKNAVHTGPGEHRHVTFQTVITILYDESCIMSNAGRGRPDVPDPGGG